jgi:transcriptional regulator with XRE-family HTH domain
MMALLGERLRELRQLRNLTLKQVAEETGLSISFLSLVERDKVSISVDNLETLARYYQVRLVNLFQDVQEDTSMITRAAQVQQKLFPVAGRRSTFMLLSYRSGARMEPLLIRVGPGHGDSEFRSLDGDMFLYVLEGKVRLISEKNSEVELSVGDSAYYYGFPGHRIVNASNQESALILLVTTPPTTLRDDVLDGRQGVLLQSEL